jgi:tetratricopeptide (TPR) repeat protein
VVLAARVARARADLRARRDAVSSAEAAAADAERAATEAEAAAAPARERAAAARARSERAAAAIGDATLGRAREGQVMALLWDAWVAPDARVARAVEGLARDLAPYPEVARVRAELLLDRGRLDEALAAIADARRAGQQDPDLDVLELRALLMAGRKADARPLVERLAAAPPDGWAARFGRLLTSGAEALDGVAEDAPPYLLIPAAQRLAMQAGDAAMLRRSAALAEAAVRAEPTSVEAIYARSSAYYDLWLGTHDPALVPRFSRDLERARALAPQPIFWIYGGKTYVLTGRPAQAEAELEVAVQLADQARDPAPSAMARAWLGAAYALDHRLDEAQAAWRSAVQLAPDADSTYDFLPYLSRLEPADRERLLAALPEARRAQARQVLAQGPR